MQAFRNLIVPYLDGICARASRTSYAHAFASHTSDKELVQTGTIDARKVFTEEL